MNDYYVMIFGVFVLVAGAGLGSWEWAGWRRPQREDWLRSPSRHRRRMLIAATLGTIGALLIAVASGSLSVRERPWLLLTILGVIMALCLLLLVMAFLDAAETARNAATHAMKELDKAVGEDPALRELAAKVLQEELDREGR